MTASNTTWYREAIFYEVFVRAFADSNGDGIGDLPGLISKLDYVQDLGVDTIWLLPITPSPLRDHGYDVSDHFNVHPDYGTLDDFRQLITEAHRRGLRIVVELIQEACTPEAVAAEAVRLLTDAEYRSRMITALDDVKRKLGGSGASDRAAEAVLDVVHSTHAS